jgi:putative ABC transport system permease protein
MSWRFWQPPLEQEVEDELAFHLDMRTRELVARGMSPEAARREATRRLGDQVQLRRRLERTGRGRDRMLRRNEFFDELWQDVRYALRQLRATPSFTAVALFTLAVGVGATTAIFSVVNAVVLRPLPFPEPERVMQVEETWRGTGGSDVSVGNYIDWRAQSGSFAKLGVIDWANFTLLEGETPERVLGARVSAEYFGVFQVPAQLGRVFGSEEDQPGHDQVVVLSHQLWVRRFGADSTVLGRTVRLNGVPVSVIGVMPAHFDFTRGTEELWVPAAFTPAQIAQHDEHYLTVFGRLKLGVTREQAQAEMQGIMQRLVKQYPRDNQERSASVTPMTEGFIGNARERLLILLGAVSLVLLIGCSNVANLLLARGAARGRELAVRAALGAGRGRIVRQLLTETMVLTLLASALGTGLAALAIRALIRAAPTGVARIEQAGLDGPTLAFALGAGILAALFAGLAPAFRIAREQLASALREGGRGSAGSGPRDFAKQGLVTAEVALALVLLVGAGLLIRTSLNLRRVDLGFDPRGVLSARVTLPRSEYTEWSRVTETFDRMVLALRAQPGITEAAISSQVPMGPGGNSNGLIPEGRPLDPASSIDSRLRVVTPGYFATLRIPRRAGRDFDEQDRLGRPRVMLVNEALAKAAWPGQNPIGKRMLCCEGTETDPMWKEVIGVVADIRSRGPGEEVVPEFFLPMRQAPQLVWEWLQRSMTLAARGKGEPEALTPAFRQALVEVDPSVPLYGISAMDARLESALAQDRFNTAILSLLGVIGMVLAAVGIYGVVAYFVTRRTREIGVRMALGATPRAVLGMTLAEGVRPALLGIVLGGVGAALATRLLQGQLRGVAATDPLTFGAVALILLAIAGAATLVPAWRATKVNALEAMRAE